MRYASLLTIVSMLLLSACYQGPEQQDALQRVRDAGVLTVACANEAPYGYKDPETGRITGEAPEIARVIADRLGIERVELSITEWGALINGLNAGRYDCIGAGMYITPERAESVLFTNPTYQIGEAFLVLEGNPKGLHGYQDVRDKDDVKLGVVRGTVEVGYAEKLGIPDSRVVVFPDNTSAVDGVRTGQVDAFAGTALTVQDLLNKFGAEAGLERAEPFENPVIDGKPAVGYGAFAFRHADETLVAAFNAELAGFIGSEEHLTLVEPFGFTEAQLPGDMTAQKVLAEQAAEAE
ncbi:MAG: ectoine/hydroxyectoine ABC transporter substrate-binding protein EhuB [Planctomycetota bacterium]